MQPKKGLIIIFLLAIISNIINYIFPDPMSLISNIKINLVIFLKILFPFFLFLFTGYLIFTQFFKKEDNLLLIILASFGISAFLNYFLVLILGSFKFINSLSLWFFYILLPVCLLIIRKHELNFNLNYLLKKKKDKYLILIIILVLAPVIFYQTFQSSYLWIDTIPNHVAPAQQVISFKEYNPFSNHPAPLYEEYHILPTFPTLFSTLGILSGMKAFFANSTFLIFQNLLLVLSFFLLAETMLGKKSGRWALLFLVMTYVWIRSKDVRGSTFSFVFLACAIIFFYKFLEDKNYLIMPSIFLSLTLITNPYIGLVVYSAFSIFIILSFFSGIIKKGIKSLEVILLSIIFSSIYLYSNLREIIEWKIFFLSILGLFIIFIFLQNILKKEYIIFNKPIIKSWIIRRSLLFIVFLTSFLIYFPRSNLFKQFPLLFILSMIGLMLLFISKEKRDILFPVAYFTASFLLIRYTYSIGSIIPLFEPDNFVPKAQTYALVYFCALIASFVIYYLIESKYNLIFEKFIKNSKVKLIIRYTSYFFVLIVLVLIILPRNKPAIEILDSHQETPLLDSWKSWIALTFNGHISVPLPENEEYEVIKEIDELISSNKILKEDLIINYIPSIDISAWSGVKEMVIFDNNIRDYPINIVHGFRSVIKGDRVIKKREEKLPLHAYVVTSSKYNFDKFKYKEIFQNNKYSIIQSIN